MGGPPVHCSRCGTESHPNSWDDFFTCYHCNARLVRRSVIGRDWEPLNSTETQRLRIIDLEWSAESEQYKVWDPWQKWGRSIPSVLGSFLSLVLGVGAGTALIIYGDSKEPGAEREQIVLWGLVALLALGGVGFARLVTAQSFRKARAAYRLRRLDAVLHPQLAITSEKDHV
jgi:hypothetical protein